MSDPRTIARRRLGVVTALWLVSVTMATHWPSLRLGTPEDPSPDKVIHMLSFALLTAGAWFSGWFRTLPRLWIAGLAWTALDEWSQAIPWLDRVSDLEDWIANAMGVTLAVAWIRATQPMGGWQSRRRRDARDLAFAEVFSRRWPWLVPPTAALMGAAASYPIFLFIAARSWAMPPRQVVTTGMIVMALASAVASIETMVRLMRPSPWPMLTDRAHLKTLAGPVLTAGAALVLLTALAQIALILRPHVATVAVLEEWYRRRPQTFRAAIDLAVILFLAAWACRRARRFMAQRIDRAHELCLRCDHLLRGLPVVQGVGRCPECGAPYERPPDALADGAGAASPALAAPSRPVTPPAPGAAEPPA